MDTAFLTGMGAFVSAVIIFIGSAFLLLTLIVGARLAYWITASVTFAFAFIMAVVWSINPLGPVGKLPEWDQIDLGTNAEQLEFDAAAQYPDSPWREPDPDDQVETTKVSELEGAATEAFEVALDKGRVDFDPSVSILVVEDSSRLIERGGTEYGLTRLEILNALEETEGEIAVVMKYDPGNPLGQARIIAAGMLGLFALHLFGLSRTEKQVAAERPEGLV